MRIQVLFLVAAVLLSLIFSGCNEEKQEPVSLGWTENIFRNENLYFGDQSAANRKDGVIALNSGRILMKKVSLPSLSEKERAEVKLVLSSSGDEWDRMGSVFVCPGEISFSDLESGLFSLTKKGKETGFVSDLNDKYQPSVELLHFCTPFGVGYYNSAIQIGANFGIPAWQSFVEWKRDISELSSYFGREMWIGILIDTWKGAPKGFYVNLDISAQPQKDAVKAAATVIPVINTIRYIGGQDYYDGFATKDMTVDIKLEKAIKDAKLYYTVSGHGGHAGGDEFKQCPHQVLLNGKKVLDFVPWRSDCKTFRAYNPTSGKDVNNNIWSSDLSRSNWCPGSKIDPEAVSLGDLTAGSHQFTFHVQGAQLSDGNKLNFWCVSAYVAGQTN